MARKVRDTSLDSRDGRRKLASRRKPYWRVIETGLHVGYRRNREASGAWIARRFVDGRYREMKLGIADDNDGEAADGITLLSFGHAQEAARTWWRAEGRKEAGLAPEDGPFTIDNALDAYFADREAHGSKGVVKDKSSAKLRIRPALGEVEITKLTKKKIDDWHKGLAKAAKLSRPKERGGKRKERPVDLDDPDAVRARKSTANRTLTVLKAALNHAFHDGRIVADDAWRRVKPFPEVDDPVVAFLSENEIRRLVNASGGAFRELVRGALLSGLRYGELGRLRASDFNAQAGTLAVRVAKSGKPRHVALNDEGRELFERLTAGKAGKDHIFLRDDGKPWGASHQQRPIEEASERAKLDPPATFHVLRHTYASALAMRGVPMPVIAAQLGHADTRITERHYAHLAPSYVANTIRAALPVFDIGEKSNIAPMRHQEPSGNSTG